MCVCGYVSMLFCMTKFGKNITIDMRMRISE